MVSCFVDQFLPEAALGEKTFAVKFPMISTAMGEGKCAGIARTGAEYVVSGDPSCLMQIGGVLSRARSNVRPLYLAEVLNQR